MKESAIHRTPVEIWREILLQVVPSIKIPDNSSDDLESLGFFQQRCGQYHQYVEFISHRRNLRLVCRLWVAILGQNEAGLIIANFYGYFWPSVDDINNAAYIYATLEGIKCHCNVKESIKPLSTWGLSLDTYSPTDPRHQGFFSYFNNQPNLKARVLSLQSGLDQNVARDLIRKCPSLEFLFWSIDDCIDIKNTIQCISHLTHLTLAMSPTKCLRGRLTLPSLRFLALHSYYVWTDPTTHLYRTYVIIVTSAIPDLVDWELPQLTMLDISGLISEDTTEDIERFILKHGPKLTSFISDFEWSADLRGAGSEDWEGSVELWDSLYNLSNFNISLNWFQQSTILNISPAILNLKARQYPMTLILSRFNTYGWVSAAEASYSARSVLEFCESCICTFDRVVIWMTWARLMVQVKERNEGQTEDGTDVFAVVKAFLEVFLRAGMLLCDQNGVVLDSERVLKLEGEQ